MGNHSNRNIHFASTAAFAVLLALSATLGLASRQSLHAVTPRDPRPATQTIGSILVGATSTSSMGEAPSGSSTMGSTSTQSMGGSGTSTPKPPTVKPKPKVSNLPTPTSPVKTSQVVQPIAASQQQGVVANAPVQVASAPVLQPVAQVLPVATKLPTTGPAGTLGLFVGVSAFGAAVHQLFVRRRLPR
jgi:hypothetical protein